MKKYWKWIAGIVVIIVLILSVIALFVGLNESDESNVISAVITIVFSAVFVLILRREDRVTNQLSGIALILTSLLFMIGFGDLQFFAFDFHWYALFAAGGVIGLVMTFLPDKKDK